MCSTPNPNARYQLPHPAGDSSAAAPSPMKHTPMIGTTRTENAPAVTIPAP